LCVCSAEIEATPLPALVEPLPLDALSRLQSQLVTLKRELQELYDEQTARSKEDEATELASMTEAATKAAQDNARIKAIEKTIDKKKKALQKQLAKQGVSALLHEL